MPYIRGVREYSYYNDEEIEHDMKFEEVQAIRLSRVPTYKPATTLAPVVEALRDLGKDGVRDDDVRETGQFVAETDLLPSDMSVTVEGVGALQFPLQEDTIDALLRVSEEDEASSTHAFTKARVIPAARIRVEVTEEALDRIVKVIHASLNINAKVFIKPNIRCMSIYGPGQFVGSQEGTEGEDDVRVEVVLPSHCVGGDLHVSHAAQTHRCSSSAVTWVAFYSECRRRVVEVREGHRVVLTYDVELGYPTEHEPLTLDDVDVALNNAVAQHFSRENRLVVLLLHRYSEDTLDWLRIKGRDSTYARALLSVAKSQDLRAFLAVGRCLESWETSGYHGPVRNGGSVVLHCWVDEGGRREESVSIIDYDGMAREVCTFGDDLWALGEPSKELKLGWYGEGPAIREQWYHRACVVLLKK